MSNVAIITTPHSIEFGFLIFFFLAGGAFDWASIGDLASRGEDSAEGDYEIDSLEGLHVVHWLAVALGNALE